METLFDVSRPIFQIEGKRAKINLVGGRVIIGKGGGIVDASTDDEDLEGVIFDTDDGDGLILRDSDIDSFELLSH